MTQYDFDQCFAEAVHRIGRPPVEQYLTAVADDLGSPIPHKYRRQVIIGLARTGPGARARVTSMSGAGRDVPVAVPYARHADIRHRCRLGDDPARYCRDERFPY